jgi:hypothetical protein
MEPAVNAVRVERRQTPRRRTIRRHGIESAHVRRGVYVTIVDASAGGVLIETSHRLLPGMPLDIHLQHASGTSTVRGRVLRCGVVQLTASSVRYRGAIVFEQRLSWLLEEVEMGSSFTPKEAQ